MVPSRSIGARVYLYTSVTISADYTPVLVYTILVYCVLLLLCSLHHRCAGTMSAVVSSVPEVLGCLHHRCAKMAMLAIVLSAPQVCKGHVGLFMCHNAAVAARPILSIRADCLEISLGGCLVGTKTGQHQKPENLETQKVFAIQILPCPPKYVYLSFKYHFAVCKSCIGTN